MPILLLVIILGIVEGVTEYLPVSSTGHLILATELLGFKADEWALFNIAIQPGAILAIIVLYWRTFWDVLVGLFSWQRGAVALRSAISWSHSCPRSCSASRFGDYIELLLANAVVVAWALIVGGIAILIVERYARPDDCGGVAAVSLKQSVMIGLVQCLAMIPGVSRSGATILGAMSFGVDRKTAAEFSFFLAVPTLAGATALQMFKHWDEIPAGQLAWIGLGSLVVVRRRGGRREGVHHDRHPLRLRAVRLVPDRRRRRRSRLAWHALIYLSQSSAKLFICRRCSNSRSRVDEAHSSCSFRSLGGQPGRRRSPPPSAEAIEITPRPHRPGNDRRLGR